MDKSSVTTIIVAIITAGAVIGAALVTGWVTRRNTKEAREQTVEISAGQLYVSLTADQRVEISSLRTRVTATEQELEKNRDELVRRDHLARVHMLWDQELINQVNQIPGINIRPAPPLVEEE